MFCTDQVKYFLKMVTFVAFDLQFIFGLLVAFFAKIALF